MSRGLMFLLAVLATPLTSFAGEPGGRAAYIGGTLGTLATNSSGSLQVVDEQYLVFYCKDTSIRVPYDKIATIEYGQKVDRRYAMAVLISPVFVLSKKREHFLTIMFADEAGREQALIFKVDKSDIRAMLVSLEARTGRKVQFQDEEARKAGKG